jgi:hypothetical protein
MRFHMVFSVHLCKFWEDMTTSCHTLSTFVSQLSSHSIVCDIRVFTLKLLQLFFLFNNKQDALIIQIYSVIKTTCFGHLLCPSLGVFCCTFGTGKFHARQFHPDSAWKRSSKTCMKLTSAECTVENSWWWSEKMPETVKLHKFSVPN